MVCALMRAILVCRCFCAQLAEVLERARPDYSIIIWDVHSAASYDAPVVSDRKTSTAAADSSFYASRATAELCRHFFLFCDFSWSLVLPDCGCKTHIRLSAIAMYSQLCSKTFAIRLLLSLILIPEKSKQFSLIGSSAA